MIYGELYGYLLCVVLLSLVITGIHVCFQPGMIFGKVTTISANFLDKTFGRKYSRIIQKPLWDCLTCMSAIWTIVLTGRVDIGLILAVCGLNYIISNLTDHERIAGE